MIAPVTTTPTATATFTKRQHSPEEVREAFQDFVGQTVFGQLISSMRETVKPAPYFHGGQAEKIFQSQLDQQIAEQISDAAAERFAGPMFDLYMMQRQ